MVCSTMDEGAREMNTALIVVDVQNDFCTGSLAIDGAEEIIPIINQLDFDLVAFTRDWHPENHCSFDVWPVHCVHDTWGAKFHPELQTHRADIIIEKGMKLEEYSGFNKRLRNLLVSRGVGRVVLCGLATDYCVFATAVEALQEGYSVHVIAEACRAVGDNHKALEVLQYIGVTIV